MSAILRLPAVAQRTGRATSTIYWDVSRGLFTPPIKIGRRASGWPKSEVDMIIAARIAGKADDAIRALVERLVASRSSAFDQFDAA